MKIIFTEKDLLKNSNPTNPGLFDFKMARLREDLWYPGNSLDPIYHADEVLYERWDGVIITLKKRHPDV